MSENLNDVVVEKDDESFGNVYEVGYIMVPSIAEENLGAEVSTLKDFILEKGASFVSEEFPKLMELSYEMDRSVNNKKQKFSNGYFGWIKFEANSDQIKIIKEALDRNEKLVRYILIRTVRENTMSSRRTYNRQEGGKRVFTKKTEEAVPINVETLDKEIEALVAE